MQNIWKVLIYALLFAKEKAPKLLATIELLLDIWGAQDSEGAVGTSAEIQMDAETQAALDELVALCAATPDGGVSALAFNGERIRKLLNRLKNLDPEKIINLIGLIGGIGKIFL